MYNIFDFNIFYFSLIFNHDFIIYIDFTHITASKPQVMTSQIRSHIKYLRQTYYILALILQSKFMKNLALMTFLNTI